MTKLFLCLLLSAYAAALIHPFEWERTVRRDWKEFASYRAELNALTSGR